MTSSFPLFGQQESAFGHLLVAAYLRLKQIEESRTMWSCGPEFFPDHSHLSSKPEHVTQAGPISRVYSLGPSDGFRDEYMTQGNGMRLNPWNLFGIIADIKALCVLE